MNIPIGVGWESSSVALWGAIAAICIVPAIAAYVYKWRKAALEADLKYEMIQRGMSADEIERVLSARMGPKDKDDD